MQAMGVVPFLPDWESLSAEEHKRMAVVLSHEERAVERMPDSRGREVVFVKQGSQAPLGYTMVLPGYAVADKCLGVGAVAEGKFKGTSFLYPRLPPDACNCKAGWVFVSRYLFVLRCVCVIEHTPLTFNEVCFVLLLNFIGLMTSWIGFM
jgi:hypothetical protein